MLMLALVCSAAIGLQPEEKPQPEVKTPRVLWTIPLKSSSFGGGAVADVNQDGFPDIAFCTYFNDSKVRVVSGKDGKEIWSYDAGNGKGDSCLDASCKFADVDKDGKLDLIVPISNTSQVICFDAATGEKKWTYSAGYGECIDTPPWIGKFGDKNFIVVGTFKSRLHVIDGTDGRMFRMVQIAPKGAVQSCPIVMDVNGDGALDFLAGTFNGDNRLVAASGKGWAAAEVDKDGRPIPNTTVFALWSIQTGGSIYHGPSVGDINGDGVYDFALGSYDGKVYAFTQQGTSLWTATPGERYIMGPTVMMDADGDGKNEVVVACEKVTVLKGDGSTLWSERFDKPGTYWAVTRGVSVSDMDGDGKPDLAALNGRGLFKVLRASDGRTLYEFDAATIFDKKMEMNSSVPIIADFDGDGKLDAFFVVGKAGSNQPEENSGLAVCLTGFDGPSFVRGVRAGWFMHRHDLTNTGCTRTPVDMKLLFPAGGALKP